MNAHLIGLAIRAKLNIILPKNQFKLDVFVLDNTHVNKNAIDRQINDKERLASTFEKESIWQAITELIAWVYDQIFSGIQDNVEIHNIENNLIKKNFVINIWPTSEILIWKKIQIFLDSGLLYDFN